MVEWKRCKVLVRRKEVRVRVVSVACRKGVIVFSGLIWAWSIWGGFGGGCFGK